MNDQLKAALLEAEELRRREVESLDRLRRILTDVPGGSWRDVGNPPTPGTEPTSVPSRMARPMSKT